MPRLGVTLAVLTASLAIAPPAGASLFTNTAPITVPGCVEMDCSVAGVGNPYPSSITVEGQPPALAGVRVTLRGIQHTEPSDIDALLVGPDGKATAFMSDACTGSQLTGQTLMFEEGFSPLPEFGSCAPAVYGATNYAEADPFPAPAPPGSHSATFGKFKGAAANGSWRLFVVDDGPSGGVGSITGGWRLDLLPEVACAGKPGTVAGNVGTAGGDILTGTPGPDVIFGLGGDDTINGLGGKDVICGGDGNDTLLGGPGKDILRGEAGRDKLKGQRGKDTCVGGAQRDKAKSCEKQKSI
jgi:hypothetical protein